MASCHMKHSHLLKAVTLQAPALVGRQSLQGLVLPSAAEGTEERVPRASPVHAGDPGVTVNH